MDENKRIALVKWIDALSERRVNGFADLQDGTIIVSVLSLLNENCPQSENGLDSTEKRLHYIQKYIEAFYPQPSNQKNVFSLEILLGQTTTTTDIFELEMGKLLLALLGCLVQDKSKERFIQPALRLETCYQFELKEMIEAVLFNDASEAQPSVEFNEVLKRKIVAEGTASPRLQKSAMPSGNNQQQTANCDTPAFAMYTNSPQPGNSSGINIRDISSPMRIMSLSSPVTPLGALMQSPQLAQKAMLRQKVQENKRLELAYQNEQHLRSELEYDLRERSALIEEKDGRIRELEKQLSEIRRMRDELDELDPLKAEKERLADENAKLQNRLTKYKDLKDHNAVLEKENGEIHAEVQKAREQMKLLDAVQKDCEDYRARCHKMSLDMSDNEAKLQNRLQEIKHLNQTVEEMRDMYQMALSQCNLLKKEKEELEGMMGTLHGGLGNCLEQEVEEVGESMSIVTDKKLSELKVEYDFMKENWIEPARYQTIQKDLEMEKESKAFYEKHYVEMKQQIMSYEEETERLRNQLQQQQSSISLLENSLQSSKTELAGLQTQLGELQLSRDNLKKSESDLLNEKEKLQGRIEALEKEMSAMHTDLDLTKKELEAHVTTSESRRQTIMQLDTEKQMKLQVEQRLSNEVETWKGKVEELTGQLKVQKEEASKCEESLKERLAEIKDELDKLQSIIKTEKHEKEMSEKSLNEKIISLEEVNTELTEKLNGERNTLKEKIAELENQVSVEISCKEEQISVVKSVTREYESYQAATKEREEEVKAELKALQNDKKEVDLELHRLKCEIKSLSQSYEEKIKKLDARYRDSEQALKTEIGSYKQKYEESLSLQKSLKDELSEAKQVIQKLRLEIEKLNKMIEEFRTDHSQLGESFEKTKMTLIEYEYEIKACKEKLSCEREQFNNLHKEKDELINSLQFQYESNVQQLKTERLQLLDQIAELEKKIDTEKRGFSEIQSNMEKTSKEKENRLQSEIKLLQHEKKELISSHETYVSELKSSTEEMSKCHKEKLNQLKTRLEEVEKERFELECAKKEQSTRIKTLSEQLHETEKSHNRLLNELNDTCASLKETIELREEKVAELNLKLQQSIDLSERLKQEHKIEKQELESLLEDHKLKFESKIVSLENNLEESQKQVMKNKEILEATNCDTERKLQLTLVESEKLMQKIKDQENEFIQSKTVFTKEVDLLKSSLDDSNKINAELVKQVHDLENKLKRLNQSRADLECQFTEAKQETECAKSKLEDKLKNITDEKCKNEQAFSEFKSQMELELSETKNKLAETESYWQSQCDQLAEEYSRGAHEQKEELKVHLEDMESDYESRLQNLSDEKDTLLANQIQAYKDVITGLEKAIGDRKVEIETLMSEKQSNSDNYERRLNDLSAMVVKYKDDCATLTSESEVLKAKCANLEQEKVKKVELLIGEYETKIAELKTSHGDTMESIKEETSKVIEKLKLDLDDQRVNYQKMISEMQEKLGGETMDLRERLSQMKCQYETLIEGKEKDTKQRVTELETKLKSLESEQASLQQTLNSEKEENSKKQNDIDELLTKNMELEKMMDKVKSEHMELEKQLVSSMGRVSRLEEELKTVQSELKVSSDGVTKEKGERQEAQRQLDYTRDRNDTLTAELSSQQQQLAAVEEEKRQLEVEITKNKSLVEEARQQSEKDARFREIEKHELERQLQASQKCYEAVQKAQTELEGQIERMGQDRLQLENRNRELEQRIYNYLEREKKMMEDNQHQMKTASELNASLREQLDAKSLEIRNIRDAFDKEMEMTKVTVSQIETNLKNELNAVTKEKAALALEVDSVQQKLKDTEMERQKLQDVNEKYNIHYNKKKEVIAQLNEELKVKNQEIDGFKHIEDKLVREVTPLREKLEAEIIKNKSLTSKIRSLEAQNDLAERKIRELKQTLDKENAHFFGDSSDFMKMLKTRENSNDASFMEGHPGTIPMDDTIYGTSHTITSDNTLTPGKRESRGRKRFSQSVSSSTLLNKENHNDMNADTVSIGSASSLAYRLRSRESAVSLNRSIASFDSCKSNASVPRGTGQVFHCEDEPLEMEWGRLGELQRRNTLCPAHLKTSYPVETQTYRPNKFREDALRESTMGNSTIMQAETGSGRKRKKTVETDSSGGESSDSLKSKLAKTGCVYQKPGPPTPANSRRSSKGSRSPGRLSNGRLSKSPKTPGGHSWGKRTPRRTPRHTPKRSAMETSGNGSAKKLGKRESIAFSVGFSPVSNHRSSRLTRQQAFIQKQPQSSGQMGPPKRKPLGLRNFLQTGV